MVSLTCFANSQERNEYIFRTSVASCPSKRENGDALSFTATMISRRAGVHPNASILPDQYWEAMQGRRWMSALFLDSSCSRSPILKRCVLSMVKFNLLPFAVFYLYS